MNGKKILVRLNGLFLCINIVLLILNLVVKSNEFKVSNKRLDNIVSVLQKEKINISAQLPQDYAPKMTADLSFPGINARYTIEKNFYGKDMVSVKHSIGESKVKQGSVEKAQYCSFNKEVLAFDNDYLFYTNEAIESSGEMVTKELAKEYCDKLISRLYPGKEGEYDIQIQKEDDHLKITYYPLFEGVPVLDTYMSFEVCEQGVKSGELYVGDITIISTEKKEIYPVDLVLFGLSDYIKLQSEQEAVNITDVKLVYQKLSNDDDMWGQEIVPTYKVSVSGLEKPIFVNAYTNEIMK